MTHALQSFKAEFFQALAHPARIRVLDRLVAGACSSHELQEHLGLDQPSVSQHLAVLRRKHFVSAHKTGTVVTYALRDPLVGRLLATAREIIDRQLTGTQTRPRGLRRERRVQ